MNDAPRNKVAASDASGTNGRSLVIQLVAILLALAAFAIWLATANLSSTERATLNPSALLAYTGEHLALTFVSTIIVLTITIPLGILLTRRPFVRASGTILARRRRSSDWWCCLRFGSDSHSGRLWSPWLPTPHCPC